jgi:hypothetical protein
MNFRKQKLTEYYGTMIVGLNKARPISALEEGRALIGQLTQLKITSSNVKNKNFSSKSIYSEKDLVVPVFICNPYEKERDISVDWTRSNSPISEIKYATVQRWWPKAIFQCSQKLGDIAEEITIETSKFVLNTQVEYAYSFEQKGLFDDIPDYFWNADNRNYREQKKLDDENDAIAFNDEVRHAGEKPVESVEESITTALFPERNEQADGKSKVIIDGHQPLPRRIGEDEVNTVVQIDPQHIPDNVRRIPEFIDAPKKKSKVALKVALGIGGAALLGVGIYFGIKFFLKKDN